MIKFKAWDKAHEVMRNVLSIDFTNRSIICEAEDEKDIKLYYTTYELMQFTGIKNIYSGMEICEGDIVKTNRSKYGRFIGYVGDATSKFEVYGVKQYVHLSAELNGTYEVIGNIYETPHLMNESNSQETK